MLKWREIVELLVVIVQYSEEKWGHRVMGPIGVSSQNILGGQTTRIMGTETLSPNANTVKQNYCITK
jgi:hypothetical protein